MFTFPVLVIKIFAIWRTFFPRETSFKPLRSLPEKIKGIGMYMSKFSRWSWIREVTINDEEMNGSPKEHDYTKMNMLYICNVAILTFEYLMQLRNKTFINLMNHFINTSEDWESHRHLRLQQIQHTYKVSSMWTAIWNYYL